MNVRANDLISSPVSIFNSDITVNMSHGALMDANLVTQSHATFNMAQNSNLRLSLASGNLVGIDTATINMTGNENLTLTDNASTVAVNLRNGATWNGTFTMGQFRGVTFGHLTVNGGLHSRFNNNGLSSVVNTENAIIRADVVGFGSFDVANRGAGPTGATPIATMEFAGAVASTQSISNSGLVVVDKPSQFFANITLAASDAPTSAAPAEIDLIGLANADSYDFKNNFLTIFSGNEIIGELRLTDQTHDGFSLKTTATSLDIIANDPARPISGALPIHL